MNADRLQPLISAIKRLLEKRQPVVVAIDGQAASGKTTAAELLRTVFDANVIHMDDFFLPDELRTAERYAEPGGNVHYERFAAEVIAGLKAGNPFSYHVFDCSVRDYVGVRQVVPKQLTIIEGAYCLHPYFGEGVYDLAVFSSITSDEQQRRILKRNGEQMFRKFLEQWIPLENDYFERHQIREKCHIVLK